MEERLAEIGKKLYTENEYGYAHQDLTVALPIADQEYLKRTYGIRTDVHRMCINCQGRQLVKYIGTKFEDKVVDSFNVRCDFVPKGLPAGSRHLIKKLQTERNMDPKRAMLALKATIDPVAWASLMFGFRDDDPDWRLRSYQKEQLRCTSQRLVVREGRRSGKTFAMALKLLYLVFELKVKKGFDSDGNQVIVGPEIMIVTPYQAQISNIFDEMEKILKRNTDLSRECTTGTAGSTYVKTPFHRMGFANGAKISGFVSGVGNKDDGSGGGTMRGQNADVIYMDEMDMIPDEILDKVVIPILLTRPNVRMVATSTPIGKRGKFYEWCKERPDFKEDYFPSTVLPHWERIKHEIESQNTKEGFAAEFMAHFIEGSHGVFKPSLVYRARGAFNYDECLIPKWWRDVAKVRDRTDLIKVIGIDWNKNAGSEFVVVAYDPNQHHWFVVEASNIAAGEYSSVNFKEEVVRLNYKWKPDYIYADEGYGHHIIEDLKVEAHRLRLTPRKDKLQAQTAKMVDTLKAFNFSQKVEFRSPIDGTVIKKSGKEFLVENTIRVFEEQRIWFSEDDESMLKQLLNYVVLRRHPSNNKPVYGPESSRIGDHRLDALMLALGGLFIEKSMYSNGSLTMSAPSSLTRGDLDKRGGNWGGSVRATDIIQASMEAGVPAHLNVLEIRRGSNEEEHNRVMELMGGGKGSNEVSRGGWAGGRQRGSRGNIGKHQQEESSVFKEMWERAQSSAGFAYDEEAAYKNRSISRPSVAKRRGGTKTNRRQWTRRRKR